MILSLFRYLLLFLDFVFFSVKLEEARKAKILFAIVMLFIVCNLPRIVLNLEEFHFMIASYWDQYSFFNIEKVDTSSDKTATICYSPPLWSFIVNHISHLLLTTNASVCCIIYCVMCRIFRSEVSKRFHKAQNAIAMVKSYVNSQQHPTDEPLHNNISDV